VKVRRLGPNSLTITRKPLCPRTLTPDEGLAVLGAALESRGHPEPKSDCSHFVHAIYEAASSESSSQNVRNTDLIARNGTESQGQLIQTRDPDLVMVKPHHSSVVRAARPKAAEVREVLEQ